jgi:pSer/pThr/pTyr-binding forkhead associated (FHA) protein
VPESLLTILKFAFLALLYLFFMRVLRAVWAELREPKPAPVGATTVAAAPAHSRQPQAGPAPTKVKVLDPESRRGQVFEVADEVTVGRAAGCGISLDDDTYVSQLHARLFRRDGTIYVEDLGSTNGTYLNKRKVSGPQALRKGDRVAIGRTVLEVTR